MTTPTMPAGRLPYASALRDAALVGGVVLAAALLGIATRPVGMLAAFWPANAVLLGLMLRSPRQATAAGWCAAMAGYVVADLTTGSPWDKAVLLSVANLAGVVAGYRLFVRLGDDGVALRGPMATMHFMLITGLASLTCGVVGAGVSQILFDAPLGGNIGYWAAMELADFIAVLPVVLTMPRPRLPLSLSLRGLSLRGDPWRFAPFATFVAGLLLAVVLGGRGAVPFPLPGLLWCALTYGLFTTSVLTLLFSAWTLYGISTGLLQVGFASGTLEDIAVLRVGIMMIAIGPLTVATVMTARNELLRRFEHLATHDPLTGAMNRAGFRGRAEPWLARLAGGRRPAAALMLDIDRFKSINDTHGHAAGDRVLIAIARTIRECLRGTDVLGRMGGEEFAVLLPDVHRGEAEAVAERIRAAFAAAAVDIGDGGTLTATVSIGVAVAAQAPDGLEDLLVSADHALYRAKHSGRNRVETNVFPEGTVPVVQAAELAG